MLRRRQETARPIESVLAKARIAATACGHRLHRPERVTEGQQVFWEIGVTIAVLLSLAVVGHLIVLD